MGRLHHAGGGNMIFDNEVLREFTLPEEKGRWAVESLEKERETVMRGDGVPNRDRVFLVNLVNVIITHESARACGGDVLEDKPGMYIPVFHACMKYLASAATLPEIWKEHKKVFQARYEALKRIRTAQGDAVQLIKNNEKKVHEGRLQRAARGIVAIAPMVMGAAENGVMELVVNKVMDAGAAAVDGDARDGGADRWHINLGEWNNYMKSMQYLVHADVWEDAGLAARH